MRKLILYMSMSLDGFVAGPNESRDNGLGDGGDRLHEWFSAGAATGHGGVPGSSQPSAEVAQWPLVTYVSDVETAMARAKDAAGEKDVLVHGVGTARLALAAGVLDELQIHLIPVLLGEGRRLFDGLGPEHIELERTRVLDGESGVTHLRYRVRR
jgi:dihydrofolate reductase